MVIVVWYWTVLVIVVVSTSPVDRLGYEPCTNQDKSSWHGPVTLYLQYLENSILKIYVTKILFC